MVSTGTRTTYVRTDSTTEGSRCSWLECKIRMELSGDELAGIVDQFGALSPDELRRAVQEAAFRVGEEPDADSIDAWIDAALAEFTLLRVDHDGEDYIVPGPRAYPTLPDAATDLRHVLNVDPRNVPPETLEAGVRYRLEDGIADVDDPDRRVELLDVTYDAEAWAGIDLSDLRNQLVQHATDDS